MNFSRETVEKFPMFLRPACLMLLLLISNKQERSLGYQVTWKAADTVRIKYYVDT